MKCLKTDFSVFSKQFPSTTTGLFYEVNASLTRQFQTGYTLSQTRRISVGDKDTNKDIFLAFDSSKYRVGTSKK